MQSIQESHVRKVVWLDPVTLNDWFEQLYETQMPQLDVLCTTIDLLTIMRLFNGLKKKEHNEEATRRAVH